MDEGAISARDWDVKPVGLIGHAFIRRIVPCFDAVRIYWIRPGREPEKDWTRRMRLRANELSLRTPRHRRGRPTRLGRGRGTEGFLGLE